MRKGSPACRMERAQGGPDLDALDAILMDSFQRSLSAKYGLISKDPDTLKRYLDTHATLEEAEEAVIRTHNWRVLNGIDSLVWTWPRHTGTAETTIRYYWPGAIMSARAYDGTVVQYNRLAAVDWRGLVQSQLVGTAVMHSTYMNELSLQIDPRGRQTMLFDLGAAPGDEGLVDVGAICVFLRQMSEVCKAYYPNIFSRIILVRAGAVFQLAKMVLTGFARISPWWEAQIGLIRAFGDDALSELLLLMPPEAIPACLGGKGDTWIGSGGPLLPPTPTCRLPWLPRPEPPPCWSLEAARDQYRHDAHAGPYLAEPPSAQPVQAPVQAQPVQAQSQQMQAQSQQTQAQPEPEPPQQSPQPQPQLQPQPQRVYLHTVSTPENSAFWGGASTQGRPAASPAVVALPFEAASLDMGESVDVGQTGSSGTMGRTIQVNAFYCRDGEELMGQQLAVERSMQPAIGGQGRLHGGHAVVGGQDGHGESRDDKASTSALGKDDVQTWLEELDETLIVEGHTSGLEELAMEEMLLSEDRDVHDRFAPSPSPSPNPRPAPKRDRNGGRCSFSTPSHSPGDSGAPY